MLGGHAHDVYNSGYTSVKGTTSFRLRSMRALFGSSTIGRQLALGDMQSSMRYFGEPGDAGLMSVQANPLQVGMGLVNLIPTPGVMDHAA